MNRAVKLITMAGSIAIAAVLALGGAASASTGAEYTNASVNPVAGYLVQSGPTANVTQVSTWVGSGDSHSLAALPESTSNGFGTEVCNSATGEAIQVGIVHTGANTMDVDYAVGNLGKKYIGGILTSVGAESNANVCQNGVLANFDVTGPTKLVGASEGIPATASGPDTQGVPAILMSGIPINDTVSVELTYDNGKAHDYRGNKSHIGDWVVTASVVPDGEYTTYAGGLTEQTAWVVPGSGKFDDAGFGTEANFAQALSPLSDGSVYLGSQAHMRLEYNSVGSADYTLGNVPAELIAVSSTSNGDAPGDGGTTYIAPTAIHNDGFGVDEGGLVS